MNLFVNNTHVVFLGIIVRTELRWNYLSLMYALRLLRKPIVANELFFHYKNKLCV